MKLTIYSVYDNVAKLFSQPIYMMNEDVAKRVMNNCVNSEGHNYNLNPSDYELYKIGEFDDQEGTLEPCQEKIVNLAAFKKIGDK